MWPYFSERVQSAVGELERAERGEAFPIKWNGLNTGVRTLLEERSSRPLWELMLRLWVFTQISYLIFQIFVFTQISYVSMLSEPAWAFVVQFYCITNSVPKTNKKTSMISLMKLIFLCKCELLCVLTLILLHQHLILNRIVILIQILTLTNSNSHFNSYSVSDIV